MYIICYEDANGNNTWEIVAGEDDMNVRVCELLEDLGCESEDIMVFNVEDEI